MIRQAVMEMLIKKTPQEMQQLTQDIEKMMMYYRCAMREVETKFLVLDDQLSMNGERNPIESVKTRLKTMRSIQQKLQRLELPFGREEIEENLNDVAGVRVICGFIDDVYMLADCLLKQDDVVLIRRKDYIAEPKPNGYRSLHLIIEIPIFLCDEKKPVRVEVQLRTIAMETWANLEHRMRYKKDLSPEKLAQIADMLNECAEMSNVLDLKMQEVRDIVRS
ncbi:MAG: GTP pyrophosphokinase family protein [Clostridia bacterium]|nr:GTP pyrophosphokinase family protein [Clostridia bacterium]